MLVLGRGLSGHFFPLWLENVPVLSLFGHVHKVALLLSHVMLTEWPCLMLMVCKMLSRRKQALVKTLELFRKYQCLADGSRSPAPNVEGCFSFLCPMTF